MVEAQSHWSMGKTGMVTSAVSFLLAALFNTESSSVWLISLLLILWMTTIMPGMLGVSAIIHAKKDAGQFIANVFAAIGFWFAGFILALIAMAIV